MPSYQVVAPGFHDGEMYKPNGKRSVLIVDKKFKKTPSWLQPIKEVRETEAEKKAKVAAQAAEAEKAKVDKVEIDSVTFVEKPSKSGPVETL